MNRVEEPDYLAAKAFWRAACLFLERQPITANLAVLSQKKQLMKDSFADPSFSEAPLAGNLLVASSLVTDSIYAHGVCLIVHQDDQHVIGVMLNRPLQPHPAMTLKIAATQAGKKPKNRLGKLLDQPNVPPENDPPSGGMIHPLEHLKSNLIHFGGPLSGPVVALHRDKHLAEAEPGHGIYMAATKGHLEELLQQPATDCRLIVGHLGWSREQFDSEVEAGIWHSIPATAETVFSSSGEMWPRLIRRATARSMARWIGTPDVIGAAELN